MIAKIVHGKNFKGAIDYITDIFGKDKQKKDARIICHSPGIPPNADNSMMAMLMDSYAHKGNHNLKEPVRHFILSFSQWDSPRLTDDLMRGIWLEFMERMGYKKTDFIVCRHKSRKNPHMHGITTRVDCDGKVISDSFEEARAARVALELTKKYGFHISSGKIDVSRDKLRGRDKAKYKIYDTICAAKENVDTWDAFYEALEEQDIQMKFHINNVTGRLLGISFSADGFSFGGKQIDKSMTLAKLEEHFGELNEIVHENVHNYYEEKREAYLRQLPNSQFYTASRLIKTFDGIFPDGLPKWGLPNTRTVFGNDFYGDRVADGDIIPSKDNKSDFVPLGLLLFILLDNYQPQLSLGGGSSSQSYEWDKKKDEEDERWKFRFNMGILKCRNYGKNKSYHKYKRKR